MPKHTIDQIRRMFREMGLGSDDRRQHFLKMFERMEETGEERPSHVVETAATTASAEEEHDAQLA